MDICVIRSLIRMALTQGTGLSFVSCFACDSVRQAAPKSMRPFTNVSAIQALSPLIARCIVRYKAVWYSRVRYLSSGPSLNQNSSVSISAWVAAL